MDVIQEQVDAFNARDLERFVACYAPAVAIVDAQGRPMMQGHAALRGMYGQLFQNSPALRCVIANRITVGNHTIDEEQITGFVMPGYPTEMHAAVVYRVEAGTIAHVQLLM